MTNSSIKKLSPRLINQISAGEVIERPASAIKELIENSIDAGADNIQIQILSQDARSFRVTDNGSGILADEIELAFTDHATSKIREIDDLNNLFTKGFRGEALASISAVSEIICLTKHKSENTATKASFDKMGKLIKMPTAFSGGTCFEVNNLFGNIPVRLKFLKRPETELQAINDIVRELAITHPEISFCLQIKDKTLFKTTGSNNWEQAVQEVFQERVNFKYFEIERTEKPEMKLKGLAAPLSESRSDKRSIITIVNKRPLQCPIMRKAIKAVYQGFLPAGKYPRIILSLSLSPDQIDVNVHPTKKEIRYTSPNLVYQLIQNSLEKHLIQNTSLAKGKITNFDKTENLPLHLQTEKKTETKKENHKIHSFDESIKFDENTKKIHNSEKPISNTQDNYSFNKTNTENKISLSPKNEGIFKIAKCSELEIKKSSDPSIKSFKAERGNSTDFCLKSGEFYVSGQVSGEKWLRDNYLGMLSDWLFNIDLEWTKKHTLLNDSQIEVFPKTISKRKKVSKKILEEIWERDGWLCIYCGKYLLHPNTAKQSLREDPHSWTERLGVNNQIIRTHLFREHQASFDHYLPVSHNPSLNKQKDNLFACCRACNQAKRDSNNQRKWQVQKFKQWAEPVKIGNLMFLLGKQISLVHQP